MERRKIGTTGISLPVVGMGTWKTFDVRGADSEKRVAEVVERAVQHGTNLFDTSPMYGEAERVLSQAIASMRDRVLVADKVWTPNAKEAREQIRRALEWYGMVDVYQIHNLVGWREHLPVLEELKQRGKIRIVGATHYQHSAFGDLLELMETGRIQLIQIPYSAADREVEKEVLPLADELGIGVMVMKPLGTGALVNRAPHGLHDFERFGLRTWAQVLLKWILSDPRIHSVLPATSSPDHAEENAVAGVAPWFDADTREWVATKAAALT